MNANLDFDRLVPLWESLQSVATIVHIDSEKKYAQAIYLLNALLDVVRDDAQHPLYSLVAVVGDLIEAYEIDHEPLGREVCHLTPIACIQSQWPTASCGQERDS